MNIISLTISAVFLSLSSYFLFLFVYLVTGEAPLICTQNHSDPSSLEPKNKIVGPLYPALTLTTEMDGPLC